LKKNSIYLLISAFIISVSSPAFFIFMLNKAGVYNAPLLVSIYFLQSIIFSYIFGKVSDRYNKDLLFILIGIISSSILYLTIYLIDNFIILIIIAALIGISNSAWTPLIMALFLKIEDKMASGKQASLINSMFSFGWAVGSIIGGIIEQLTNLNMVFIFMSIIGGISIIPLTKLITSYKTNKTKDQLFNNIKNSRELKEKKCSIKEITIRGQDENYNQIIIFLIICISLRYLCSQGAVVGILPNYIQYELIILPGLKGFILSINMITQCIFIIPLGYLIDKLGKRPIFFVGLIGSGLNSIFYSMAHNIWFLILNQMLIGFSYSAIVSSTTAIIRDISDCDKYGQGMGINNMARSVGGMVGPFLAFFLLNFSYDFAFQILGIIGLISGLIAVIFLKENKINSKYSIRFIKKLDI